MNNFFILTFFFFLSFNVISQNPPIANDDDGGVLVQDGVDGLVLILLNDSDADGNPSAPVNGVGQFTVDLDPNTAGIQSSFTTPDGTNWALNVSTGLILCDPAAGFNGTTTITYQLCDPMGACDDAIIAFSVTPSGNSTPDGIDDDGGSLTQDGADGTVDILANDIDLNGNPTAPTNGVGQFTVDVDPILPGIQTSIVSPIDGSTWTYDPATGILTCNPAAGFTGTTTGGYYLCDPDGACDATFVIVTFIVNPAGGSNPPLANDDNGGSIVQDGADGTVEIISNDTDIDGNPSVPTNGVGQFTVDVDPLTAGVQTTFVSPLDGTTWTYDPATGIITCNPADGFNGTTTTIYTLCDPTGVCANATITFVVTPLATNNTPVAVDDASTTAFETPVTTTVLANDNDPDGDPLTVTISVQSADGNAVVNGDNTITFTPNAGFSGTTTYTYQICDNGSPALCATAIVTITVNAAGINSAPNATDDITFTAFETPTTTGVTSNDDDPDGDNLTVTIVTQSPDGNAVVNGNGSITFTPNAGFSGTATYTYQICDDGTPVLCDQATVTITVGTETNIAPVAENDADNTAYETPVTTSVLGNDYDLNGDNLTVSIVIQSLDGIAVVNGNGTITFTPNTGFSGTTSYVYEICDDGVPIMCEQGTVTITVAPTTANVAPIAIDDIGTCEENGVNGLIYFLSNDSDINNNGNPITDDTHTIDLDVNTPGIQSTFISLSPAVTWTYLPEFDVLVVDPGQDVGGTITLTYEICDNNTPPLCDQGVITVNITPSTASIDEINNLFSIFPNPVTDVLTILSNENIENVNIYSSDGKVLIHSDLNKFNVSELNAGIYFVEVKLLNGLVKRNTFMKL
jgi:hypothetical protein